MIKQKSSEMGVSKKEKRGLVITEIFYDTSGSGMVYSNLLPDRDDI